MIFLCTRSSSCRSSVHSRSRRCYGDCVLIMASVPVGIIIVSLTATVVGIVSCWRLRSDYGNNSLTFCRHKMYRPRTSYYMRAMSDIVISMHQLNYARWRRHVPNYNMAKRRNRMPHYPATYIHIALNNYSKSV